MNENTNLDAQTANGSRLLCSTERLPLSRSSKPPYPAFPAAHEKSKGIINVGSPTRESSPSRVDGERCIREFIFKLCSAAALRHFASFRLNPKQLSFGK